MRTKKALFNVATNLCLQVVVLVYGFIVPKIIINYYGSNVNGLISSITQFLAYITLLESGFGPVVKAALYKPIADKDNKTIANILKTAEKFFKNIAYIFLLYIFLLCFLYPMLVERDFGWVFTAFLIVIIGISIFAEYFFGMTYKLYLQAKQNSYVISFIQILTYLMSVVAIVILVRLNISIHIVKLVSGLIFVLRPLLQNLYVKKKFKIDLNSADDSYTLKNKWDGLAQHIAAVIHDNTDVVVLTIFTTLTEVSVYAVYYLVVKGIKSIIQSFVNGIDSAFGDMIVKKENNNLNKKFSIYEVLYNGIITIAFTCAIILITPFITVYTNGITDANYIRPLFGVLLVISEYIWAIRLPYNSITLAAGHFKETRVGAWVECLSNIIISIILVNKYGLVGVAIGTMTAMTIRTIEFIYHTNKFILKRSIVKSINKIIALLAKTLIIIGICHYIPFISYVSYFSWIRNAIIVFVVACGVSIIIDTLFFRNEFGNSLSIIKNFIKKGEKNENKS